MKASDLFVRCLENEGVEHIFGIPGEENLDVMDSLIGSSITFITTRHEQGAAFMADVYGRLTGKAGVCLSTLGPGATNLVTGFADANMDRAPIIGIAGQGATTRMHKESHQVLDLVNLFAPISKYSVQIHEPAIVGEIVRKAFKAAEAEKPGGSFIAFPENIAAMPVEGKAPLHAQSPKPPVPPQEKITQAANVISQARYPLVVIKVMLLPISESITSRFSSPGIPKICSTPSFSRQRTKRSLAFIYLPPIKRQANPRLNGPYTAIRLLEILKNNSAHCCILS